MLRVKKFFISRKNDLGLKFRKDEDNEYEVYYRDLRIGWVYYDEEAWSGWRWFITGIPQDMEWGGVNSMTRKAEGFPTRIQAANYIAERKSLEIIEEMMKEREV